MKIKYKKLFFAFLLAFFAVLPFAVFALEIDYPNFFGLTITNNSTLPEYAKYFFNMGMGIAGLLALIVITIGGTYYLISFASGKFTNNGKEWIKSGVTGLLILLSSYLIAYTINPDLVVFKLQDLIPIASRLFPPGGPSPNLIPTSYYREIPIGVITEKLVSRTRDCYDFDQDGNPIEGEKILVGSKTVGLPTYLDHDRVDCVLKLTEAAQKKSKVIDDLSKKIIKLMEQCSCEKWGKCETNPGAFCSVGMYPNEKTKKCEDMECVKVGCNGKNDCCPPGVRDKIEGIGEARIEIEDCKGNIKKYKGLEEFRTRLFTISPLIESQISAGGRTVTIIDKIKWQNLKLREQLMYIKEKIAQIQSEIESDRDQLESVEADMSGSLCRYIIKSSADILKIKENADIEKKAIAIQKTYTDPVKGGIINSSKYCKGFNYSNSSCFKTCQDKCPDSNFQVAATYASCGDCEKITPDPKNCKCKAGDKSCFDECIKKQYEECLERQQACVERKYNERPCLFSGSPEDDSFEGCVESCKGGCFDLCKKRYLDCSPQLKICEDQCYNNSKCVLENKDVCLIDGEGFQGCGAENNDAGNFKNCIDNAYLCKYGSQEYAGYPDCFKAKNTPNYSSPYIFKYLSEDPSSQNSRTSLLRCPKPYAIAIEEGTTTYCLDVFPETGKCPPSSKCPQCPCGSVDETLIFSDDIICAEGECLADGECSPGNCNNGGNGSESGGQCPCSVGECLDLQGNCLSKNCTNEITGCLSGKCLGTDGTCSFENCNFQASGCQKNECLSLPKFGGLCSQQNCINPVSGCRYGCLGSDKQCSTDNCCDSGGGQGGVSQNEERTVKKNVLVTAECSDFAYNQDPLTFYCKIGWEPEGPLFGTWSGSSKVEEIPVGQTIDDSEKWANDLIEKISSFNDDVKEILNHMKKIGDKKKDDYCMCDSKYDTGDPICTNDCEFYQEDVPVIDPETGEIIYDKNGDPILETQCFCKITPCAGNPCQQMIDYLKEITELYQKIRKGFIDFYVYFISEERTDILKELTYSRKTMNSCSQHVIKIGEEIVKPFSCEKAYGNNFLNERCYGILEGETKTPPEKLADNWFCPKEDF